MNYKRKFVIGDIHGAYKALKQCFKASGFDYENDQLICLGDVCDGWPEINKVFDELLKIKNLIYIIGNHDLWALNWSETGEKPKIWLMQGGQATIDCYPGGLPEKHKNILKTAKDYYLDRNKLFIHGGFLPDKALKNQDREIFIWDRSLFQSAMYNKDIEQETKLTKFDEVYIGHTPIERFGYLIPFKACEIWMMDTGAGWTGVLSMMNIDTKEYFTSERCIDLYPDHPGRF